MTSRWLLGTRPFGGTSCLRLSAVRRKPLLTREPRLSEDVPPLPMLLGSSSQPSSEFVERSLLRRLNESSSGSS